MALKNMKRIAREKAFEALHENRTHEAEAPLKAKYTTELKTKAVRSKRVHNSGGKGRRARSWGPYRNPPSPWDNKR